MSFPVCIFRFCRCRSKGWHHLKRLSLTIQSIGCLDPIKGQRCHAPWIANCTRKIGENVRMLPITFISTDLKLKPRSSYTKPKTFRNSVTKRNEATLNSSVKYFTFWSFCVILQLRRRQCCGQFIWEKNMPKVLHLGLAYCKLRLSLVTLATNWIEVV